MDTRSRLSIAGLICLLPAAPLAARLAHLQVLQHRELESRADGAMKRTAQDEPPRAPIVDREGRVLAESLPVWSCFVDKAMVKDLPALAGKLAPALRLGHAEALSKLKAKGRFARMADKLDFDTAQAVRALKLDSVGIASGSERFYPNGDLARGLLGAVGSERRGLAGVELAADERLKGQAGVVKLMRDGSGKHVYKGDDGRARRAEPLRLSIDRSAQFFAHEALEEAAASKGMRAGMVAVQDPRTGEILALATYPEDPLRSPAVQDPYEPGSTFKTITIAAALESGTARPEDTVFCENGKYELAPGVTISDHEPLGEASVREVLEQSSNIGTAKIVERVGAERWYRMSRAFGFASRTGVGLPGEASGELKPLADLTRVGLAASSYGYGVSATPLQVLSAYSAVANGGLLMEPTIFAGREPVAVRRVASAPTIAVLKSMLEGVVEKGTGLSARIPGYRIAGKTGTSRKLDKVTKKYSTSSYVASFAGFLPASDPRWTILVIIDEPKGLYYGSQTAAPIFQRVAQRLLALKGVPPDAPLPKVAASR